MKRRILTVVLILFVLQAQFAFAAQKEVTKEYTFVTNKDAELTFADVGKGDLSDIPLTIEASGKRYQAATAEFSLAKEPEKVKETYEDLTAKDVPESIEKDGEVYTLTDVKWTETKRTAATGSKRYYGYNTKPDAPAEKEITATLPDGSRITVTGKFVEIRRVQGGFDKPFAVTAKFIGDPDVENYILPDGSKIPNDETIPVFKGYEDVILKNLGYSPKNYRITGGKWITDYYTDDNGETCRKAKFTGTQRGTDWVATYREVLSDASPSLATYTAACTYRADTMTVKAVVTYENESHLKAILILTAAAIAIIALFTALLLFFLKKKREDGDDTADEHK